MTRGGLGRWAAACALGVTGWLACGPGDLSDLTAGRAPARDAAAVGPCATDGLPDAPDAGPFASSPVRVFAMEDIRLDNGAAPAGALAPPRGLNLDGTCACRGPGSCAAPPGAGAALCDDDEGRDNAMAALFTSLGAFPAFSYDAFRKRIAAGGFTILVVLTDWNGTPDDDRVGVAVVGSPGSKSDGQGTATVPRFDGTDEWLCDRDAFSNGATSDAGCAAADLLPRYASTGYVRNRTLVARFNEVRIALNTDFGRLALQLKSAVLLARLDGEPGGRATLSGEIAGRHSATQLLETAATLRFPSLGIDPLCASPAFEQLKQAICPSVDLAADPRLDRTGAPCDSISGALAFRAGTAKAGDLFSFDAGVAPDCGGAVVRCE